MAAMTCAVGGVPRRHGPSGPSGPSGRTLVLTPCGATTRKDNMPRHARTCYTCHGAFGVLQGSPAMAAADCGSDGTATAGSASEARCPWVAHGVVNIDSMEFETVIRAVPHGKLNTNSSCDQSEGAERLMQSLGALVEGRRGPDFPSPPPPSPSSRGSPPRPARGTPCDPPPRPIRDPRTCKIIGKVALQKNLPAIPRHSYPQLRGVW